MKLLSASILLACLLGGQAGAQSAQEAETIAPSDLGIRKILFRATPGDGQVVIFRKEVESEIGTETYDVVSFIPNKERTEFASFYELGFLDRTKKDQWLIYTGMSREDRENFKFISSKIEKDRAEFVFEDDKKMKEIYRLSIFLAFYDDVKDNYPNFPAKEPGWTFSHVSLDRKDDGEQEERPQQQTAQVTR